MLIYVMYIWQQQLCFLYYTKYPNNAFIAYCLFINKKFQFLNNIYLTQIIVKCKTHKIVTNE